MRKNVQNAIQTFVTFPRNVCNGKRNNIYSSPFEARALNDVHLLALVGNTPVLLIKALDDYSEHLPLRASHFHTPRCRKLKFLFHIQFFILYKTR